MSLPVKVKDFLTPENWCKGEMAVDLAGNPVSWQSSEAVKWCVLGAIGKCYGRFDTSAIDRLKDVVVKRGYPKWISSFNDMVEWDSLISAVEEAGI